SLPFYFSLKASPSSQLLLIHPLRMGPILGGTVIDFVGINSTFYFGAVITLLGAGLFTRLSIRR
ncbi:MAG: hypothetical protein KKD83_08765, partial [Chloroflexi bacterium]|nr:hypothetical protein [Chloroflexota bacterium]